MRKEGRRPCQQEAAEGGLSRSDRQTDRLKARRRLSVMAMLGTRGGRGGHDEPHYLPITRVKFLPPPPPPATLNRLECPRARVCATIATARMLSSKTPKNNISLRKKRATDPKDQGTIRSTQTTPPHPPPPHTTFRPLLSTQVKSISHLELGAKQVNR